MDKRIYHIIKQHHNFTDRPANDRKFLSVYSKFSGWLIKYQLTTKTDYINDLNHFKEDATKNEKNGIADISTRILKNIEPELLDYGIYDIEDITENQGHATPITWGQLWELAKNENDK